MKRLIIILAYLTPLFSYNTSIAQVDPNPEIDYELLIKKETANNNSGARGILGIENNEAMISYYYGTAHEEGYSVTAIVAHLDAQGNITNKIEFSDDGETTHTIHHIGKTESNSAYLALYNL